MTKFGDDLTRALEEALAHARGKDLTALKVNRVETETVDTKSVRRALKLTQEEMALLLGTSTSGYRKWEQGQREPSGAARTLLKVMEKEPEAVLRALEP